MGRLEMDIPVALELRFEPKMVFVETRRLGHVGGHQDWVVLSRFHGRASISW